MSEYHIKISVAAMTTMPIPEAIDSGPAVAEKFFNDWVAEVGRIGRPISRLHRVLFSR